MQARHRMAFPVMGTTASVHVNDDVSAVQFASVTAALQAELERLEQIFSVYRPTSEISRINTGELHLLDASPEVIDVMDACTWLEQVSEGAFRIRPRADDPTLNSSGIDPSGFVKGWAAERASRLMLEAGLEHWYLGVGGDYVLHGGFDDATPWVIGVAHPLTPDTFAGDVTLMTGGIATSGTAERGEHIWRVGDDEGRGHDDETQGFASVTVVGPSLTWADAFATTVFAMGEPGLDWIGQFTDYQVLVVPITGPVAH